MVTTRVLLAGENIGTASFSFELGGTLEGLIQRSKWLTQGIGIRV